MVGDPPAGAGDAGLIPGPGGSRMPRGCWARAPGARAPQQERPPLTTAGEGPRAATETQCS